MRASAKSTAANGWMAASVDSTGVINAAVQAFLVGFRKLDSDEARGVFADHWISLAADRLNETWPALYELLRVVRERELYRNPTWNEDHVTYASFDAYFTAKVKQPFATWAELEAAHGFVTEHAPELINAPLTEVIAEKASRERIRAAAEATTGDVLPSDGSVHPGNARKFSELTQSKRGAKAGVSDRTQRKLDRLKREFPELHAEIVAGRMSVHRAAVEAGIDHPTVSVRTDDPAAAAAFLAKHFTADTITEIMTQAIRLQAEGGGLFTREGECLAIGLAKGFG